jgi:hypothetical protein
LIEVNAGGDPGGQMSVELRAKEHPMPRGIRSVIWFAVERHVAEAEKPGAASRKAATALAR